MNSQKVLEKDQLDMVGRWVGDRFYIHRYYHTSTSCLVPSPDNGWPYSELAHAYTSEYYNSLTEDQLNTLNKIYIGI
jgi:hypothetical protein